MHGPKIRRLVCHSHCGRNGNVKKCAVGKHPKSEKHGFTLVLEAGETYVHIVTLVDKTRSFQAKPGTRVFVVDRYGAFAEDPSRSRPFRRTKKEP